MLPKNSATVLIAGNCRWKIKRNCYIIFCDTRREQKQPCSFSQGCFHLTKSFSKNSHGAVGNGNWAAVRKPRAVCVWEREARDKVATHYAALPHFVVLNGLNKCNNKTLRQAYRAIVFCNLYVNHSIANRECVPDRAPDTTQHPRLTRFSPLTNFLCLLVTLSTIAHAHLLILFATVGSNKAPSVVYDMWHGLLCATLSQNALPGARHLAHINSGLRSLAEKRTRALCSRVF